MIPRSAVDSAPPDEMISLSPAAGGVEGGPLAGGRLEAARCGTAGGTVRLLQVSGVAGLQRDGLVLADRRALLLEEWKAWRLASTD